MFLERQKLDMCKSVFDRIVSEQRPHFAISQGTIVLLGNSPPRSKMNFVDRKRFAPCSSFLASSHPRAILTLVVGPECDCRSVLRNLHHERVLIRFEQLAPAASNIV